MQKQLHIYVTLLSFFLFSVATGPTFHKMTISLTIRNILKTYSITHEKFFLGDFALICPHSPHPLSKFST